MSNQPTVRCLFASVFVSSVGCWRPCVGPTDPSLIYLSSLFFVAKLTPLYSSIMYSEYIHTTAAVYLYCCAVCCVRACVRCSKQQQRVYRAE